MFSDSSAYFYHLLSPLLKHCFLHINKERPSVASHPFSPFISSWGNVSLSISANTPIESTNVILVSFSRIRIFVPSLNRPCHFSAKSVVNLPISSAEMPYHPTIRYESTYSEIGQRSLEYPSNL